jgi:hypothetical protein
MINFKKILSILLNESNANSSIRVRLERAIKNRTPVSFYYKGPSGEVLPGRRIKVELVASGLTKKGNLAVRGYVQPPSVSKKGFQKHGWRTFLISRIAPGSLNIYDEEQFNEKRPGYKEGDDSSFQVTYVKSDWGFRQEPKTDDTITNVEPNQPEEPKPTELPQPKKKEKPSLVPIYDRASEVFDILKTKVKTVNNQSKISTEDLKNSIDDLYRKKIEDWRNYQKDMGVNSNPGEGTRRKYEKESESELYNILKKNNIQVTTNNINDLEDNENLQEQIRRIKTLFFS